MLAVQPSLTPSIRCSRCVAPNVSRSSTQGTMYGVILRMTRASFLSCTLSHVVEIVLGGRCPSHSAGIGAKLEGEEGVQRWALSQRATQTYKRVSGAGRFGKYCISMRSFILCSICSSCRSLRSANSRDALRCLVASSRKYSNSRLMRAVPTYLTTLSLSSLQLFF